MRGKAGVVVLALMLVLLPTAARAAGSGSGPSLRVAEESPSGLPEVLIGSEVVMRLRSPLGGLSADDRALVVVMRLASLLYHGLDPETIIPAVVDGQVVVAAAGLPVVTVDEVTAGLQGVSRCRLALTWSNNLRRILGASSLEAGTEYGLASWYGPGFHGRKTANGEIFDQEALTAAHRTLPFGTMVVVTRVDTGQAVIVRINDRGPWVDGRVIDLSRAAAGAIGLIGSGLAEVRVTAWKVADGQP